jgi:hypothetical protein
MLQLSVYTVENRLSSDRRRNDHFGLNFVFSLANPNFVEIEYKFRVGIAKIVPKPIHSCFEKDS